MPGIAGCAVGCPTVGHASDEIQPLAIAVSFPRVFLRARRFLPCCSTFSSPGLPEAIRNASLSVQVVQFADDVTLVARADLFKAVIPMQPALDSLSSWARNHATEKTEALVITTDPGQVNAKCLAGPVAQRDSTAVQRAAQGAWRHTGLAAALRHPRTARHCQAGGAHQHREGIIGHQLGRRRADAQGTLRQLRSADCALRGRRLASLRGTGARCTPRVGQLRGRTGHHWRSCGLQLCGHMSGGRSTAH